MTALDAVGPHEVLCRIPGATVKRAALKAGLIQTDSGLQLTAENTIKDVSQADILIVPGAGSATTLHKYPEVLEWICSIHKTTQWSGSVCTGSLILGAAGLLKGVNATTHWAAFERLKKYGAIPVDSRVVEDGKLITAAGVSAGIDMALTLIAKVAGEQVAKTLQLAIEYDPAPPFNSGSPKKADPELLKRLQERMTAVFE